jgi:transposase
MKAYRYITLSSSEKELLEYSQKNGDKHYFRTICYSLLQSSEGKKVSEIALLVKMREETIRRWYDKWEREGISGLKISAGRGRKSRLSISDESTVETIKKSSVESD